ncbi:MAG: carbohydrate porin [Gemmatimonadota bacterium]|nr:carbohydrate porin [Gemmatimonadota bacterium]
MAVALLGAQIDLIGQQLAPFHSPYQGPNSLDPHGDAELSEAFGAYAGFRRGKRFSAYLDAEMVRGAGISRVVGLGGLTNGDVIRQGSADLGSGPYVARAFVRYVVPLGRTSYDTAARSPDQMPEAIPSHRLELIGGKLAASDIFDVSRYAGSPRTQFMNWGLFQNTAWDFAADTRGYTNGIAIGYVAPTWALRAGSFQMPTKANGNEFDPDIGRARGDNVELTLVPRTVGPIIRLLAFVNHARMGKYADAIAAGLAQHAAPDVAADDRPGRIKYGFGANMEEPLADSGETGVFLRAGWNDGATESFAFAEVEHQLSGGAQLSGAHWSRRNDRFAIAVLLSGLGAAHHQYLAAGGSGFLLGDGALSYGIEQIFESYYRAQLGRFIQVSPDIQYIRNPGYNRARGPATVASLRLNLRY